MWGESRCNSHWLSDRLTSSGWASGHIVSDCRPWWTSRQWLLDATVIGVGRERRGVIPESGCCAWGPDAHESDADLIREREDKVRKAQ